MLAHAVGADALSAPTWLLAYIGVALVLGTAAALRVTWPGPRYEPVEPGLPVGIGVHLGHVIGLLAYAAVVAIAIVGPDSSAANLAPWLIPVVWVGLPIVCLLAGDVVRHLNPFLPVVAALDRGRSSGRAGTAPSWTAAVFLAAWSWYLLAYHRPGSPRALAIFLLAYAVAAIAGGLRWGRAWLGSGEAFGALSAAVARIGVRWKRTTPFLGAALLMVMWIGGTAFDGLTYQPFWLDVLGTSTGWVRTLLNTAGLLWVSAIVGGAFLLVARVAERGQDESHMDRSLAEPLGRALVPMAVGWFLGHDLTLLLGEGQNAYALASDPLGRGWDLLGTYDHTVDYSIATEPWVLWTQALLLAAGHIASVVLLHELAMQRLSPRAAMRTTWTMAAVSSVSIAAACVLVFA